MKTLKTQLMILSFTIALSGCASSGYHSQSHYPYRNTLTGAAIGAAGGALLGHAADDSGRGALVGGAVGAVVGGATGYYLDQKKSHEVYHNRQTHYNDGYHSAPHRQPRTYPYPH